MKTKAKIEYFGEFAGGEVAYRAKAEANINTATEVAVSAKAKSIADAEELAKQRKQELISRQTEQAARTKSRIDARSHQSKDQGNLLDADVINIEKGIKGLK